MSKIVALQSSMSQLASHLREHGYKVIDIYEASSPGAHVDAFLYSSYHPEILSAYSNLAESADLSLGNATTEMNDLSSTIMINITSLKPDQVLSALNKRLLPNPKHR